MKFKWQSIVPFVFLMAAVGIMAYFTLNNSKTAWMEDRYKLLMQVVDAKCDAGIDDLAIFCKYFSNLDTIYNVFAAVYSDSNNLLTTRTPDIIPKRTVFFEPLTYMEVTHAFKYQTSGIVNVDFEITDMGGKSETYYTPMYFRTVSYQNGNVIVALATPFIPDTVILPSFYFITLASMIVFVLISGVIALVASKKEKPVFIPVPKEEKDK